MKTSEDSSSNVKSPVTQPLGAYKAAIPSKARGVFKVAVGDAGSATADCPIFDVGTPPVAAEIVNVSIALSSVRVQRDASNARDVLRGASGKTSANTYNRIFGDRKRASDGRIHSLSAQQQGQKTKATRRPKSKLQKTAHGWCSSRFDGCFS